MLRATLVITGMLYLVLLVTAVRECAFLRPLLPVIWRDYQGPMVVFSALFLFNCGVAIYRLLRWLTLAETGAKLAEVEKGLRGRTTISRELTDRLLEDR